MISHRHLTTALIGLVVALFTSLTLNAQTSDPSMTSQTQSATQTIEPGDVVADISTTMGDIRILLYGDTPKHRDNFVKLAREGYFDGVLFHRVIRDFMVQTGDPDSKDAPAGKRLGMGDPGYTIEAEFEAYPKRFHKYGAIAAAREGDRTNPAKRSSGSQFYIVTGKKYSPAQLDQMNARIRQQQLKSEFDRLVNENRDSILSLRKNRDLEGLQIMQDTLAAKAEAVVKAHPLSMTPEQHEAYMRVGGAPHLDGSYTVFGEVLSGMDVVERIQQAETDPNDRPTEDIRVNSVTIEETPAKP